MSMFLDSEQLNDVIESLAESLPPDSGNALLDAYGVMADGDDPQSPLEEMIVMISHDVVRRHKSKDLHDVVSQVGNQLHEAHNILGIILVSCFSRVRNESSHSPTAACKKGKRSP